MLPAALDDLHEDQYNSTGVEEFWELEFFPYPVWREPAMHQMLIDVALGGAQAFIQSQRPGRMSQNVLLRIDLALTQHGHQVGPHSTHEYTSQSLPTRHKVLRREVYAH